MEFLRPEWVARSRSGLSDRSVSSPGGHFIPDAPINFPVDINGTNRPAMHVVLSMIDVQTEEMYVAYIEPA